MRKNQQDHNDQKKTQQRTQQHLTEQEQRQKQALSNQGSQDRQVSQPSPRREDDDASR